MKTWKKHLIGTILLFFIVVFFYAYSFIVLNIIGFPTFLTGIIFLIIYIGLLILSILYYQKNKLLAESVMLSIFCLTFANPLFLSLVYSFFESAFDGTETLVTISNVLDVFGFPFNIFYTMVPQIIMLIVPIIPVVSLIVMVIKKKTASSNTGDGYVC